MYLPSVWRTVGPAFGGILVPEQAIGHEPGRRAKRVEGRTKSRKQDTMPRFTFDKGKKYENGTQPHGLPGYATIHNLTLQLLRPTPCPP